ncbi:FadR/GntR family transcriptional regulator [Propionivibrio sp.]|uniref:FadR/GntR family transcriptional regulator n=1 Tax=Propionivibrio sp. TaxID=2212460 RepID=UPI0039E4BEC6
MAKSTLFSSAFSSARTTSKNAQVASDIGQRIILGQYPVETTLPREADFLAEFGVSRPVLREAIKTLESKGMVESRQQRGITVLPRDRWNFLDVDILGWIMRTHADPQMLVRLTEVRMIIEPGACMLAANCATPSGLSRIEDAWHRMNAYVNDDKLYVEADRDFHIAILMASGNEYLAAFGTVISAALMSSLQRTNPIENNQSSLPWHYSILEALRSRNGVLAARASRKQIKAALSLLQTEQD